MHKIILKRRFDNKNLKYLLLPLFICGSFFLSLTLILGLSGPYITDFLVCLLASYLLYAVSKDNLYYVVNVLFILLILYVINRVKLQYLGTPVLASDILSIIALYDIQVHAVKVFTLLMLAVFFLIFFLNLKYTKNTLLVMLAIVLVAPASYLYAYSTSSCGNAETPCVSSYNPEKDSAIKQFSISLIDLGRELFEYPDKQEVLQANQVVDNANFGLNRYYSSGIDNKRNVYFILIESLWDPTSISKLKFTVDPFDENFRQLWRQGGYSTALSPVFGGGTANPEFELLCGLPVTSNIIQFELPVLNSDLPCLPNLLKKNGYTTIANHPNVRGFWNRDEAYPKLGFEQYYSINDFVKDDMLAGTYLSDSSLYSQSFGRASGIEKPVFNYVLTAAEHYPYVSTGNSNTIVGVDSDNEYLSRYVNLIRLGTKQVYQYYERLRKSDPKALVVILGDHLPVLGKDFALYRENGFFDGVSDSTPRQIMNMFSVPLIIIDGARGPVNVGAVSTYEIPQMIAGILFGANPSQKHTASDDKTIMVSHYRPLANKGVLFSDNGGWHFCQSVSVKSKCKQSLGWQKAARIVKKDITIGHKLSILGADKYVALHE